MNNFLRGRLKSLKYAIRGFFLLVKTEHSIIAQSFIFLSVIILDVVLGISKQDWINQTFAMLTFLIIFTITYLPYILPYV